MQRKIYVASSWRNQHQPSMVRALKGMGHEVYDFRNPEPGDDGFRWSELDRNYQKWWDNPVEYVLSLEHPKAKDGYNKDYKALNWADTCILLLPCGRSAHLEAGYAIGQGKQTAIFVAKEKFEPELMYKMANLVTDDVNSIYTWVGNA